MVTEPLRVLIVDDDEIVAELHRAFVADLDGFVVAGAVGTGPDAVVAIRTRHPDIVLLDMHLPGFSGLEVLRITRADRRIQPEVIAVTAARDVDSVREARRAGVRHYLAKPFAAGDLRARLREVGREFAARATAAATVGELPQGRIDAMMSPAAGGGGLPKGLSAETLAIVHNALVGAPGSSATELGERLGLSRVSSRRYLEHLADGGAARRTLDYTTSGRPTTRYEPIGAVPTDRPR
jgi:response regulator of citrate/malate metabolism